VVIAALVELRGVVGSAKWASGLRPVSAALLVLLAMRRRRSGRCVFCSTACGCGFHLFCVMDWRIFIGQEPIAAVLASLAWRDAHSCGVSDAGGAAEGFARDRIAQAAQCVPDRYDGGRDCRCKGFFAHQSGMNGGLDLMPLVTGGLFR